MEDKKEHSEGDCIAKSCERKIKIGFDKREKNDTSELSSKGPISETGPTELQGSTKTASTQKGVGIRLEPSLSEKLAKKRAVADELEDKLHNFRLHFDGKHQSVERVKQELKSREKKLIQSVQKIERYMRDMYSLKREADDMIEKLEITAAEQYTQFFNLSDEYNRILTDKGTAIKILEYYRPAEHCLENIILDMKKYTSTKELVEYYLVLELLREDILEEDKRCLREEQHFTDERRLMSERVRSHPVDILAKQDVIYAVRSQTKEIRLRNVELEQRVNEILSARVKKDMTWHNIQNWVDQLYKKVCEIIPPDLDESKVSVLDQLQKLEDFVKMGTKILERQNKETV